MLTTCILSLAAATSALRIRAPATFFHLTGLAASDHRDNPPAESHVVTFTVSNPNAVYEQGGKEASTCSISWSGHEVATCLTPCHNYAYDSGDSPYYARVVPRGAENAREWSLQISEYFTYKNSALNDVVVPFTDGQEGYSCYINEHERTICGITEGNGRNVTFQTTFSVSYPADVC